MDKTLKQMIRDKGFKQLEVAKYLNISESQVSLLLKGKRRMNIDQAFELATLMEVSLDDLFVGLNTGREARQ